MLADCSRPGATAAGRHVRRNVMADKTLSLVARGVIRVLTELAMGLVR